jgi:hypothetical protein
MQQLAAGEADKLTPILEIPPMVKVAICTIAKVPVNGDRSGFSSAI